MELWYALGKVIIRELSMLAWYDIIEVVFFIIAMLSWLRWLNADKEKNLATIFCFYSIVAIGSYYTELTTISMLLMGGFPLIMVIFIMLHQKSLQQNFITLTRLSQSTENSSNSWLSELMSFALSALYKQQDLIFIIERNNNLSLLLTSSCIIQALLTKEFLELLTGPGTLPIYNLWLTHQGTIVGINTLMNHTLERELLANDVKHLPPWQQEALFITKTTDALVIKGSSNKKSFTLIIEGKCIEDISPQQTMVLLTRYIYPSSYNPQRGFNPSELEGIALHQARAGIHTEDPRKL